LLFATAEKIMPTNIQEKQTCKLNTNLRYLKGIGPERYRIFQKYGFETFEDLMYLMPRRYEDRRTITPISELESEVKQLVVAKILDKRFIRTRRGPSILKLKIGDESGSCQAAWFNAAYLNSAFSVGQSVIF